MQLRMPLGHQELLKQIEAVSTCVHFWFLGFSKCQVSKPASWVSYGFLWFRIGNLTQIIGSIGYWNEAMQSQSDSLPQFAGAVQFHAAAAAESDLRRHWQWHQKYMSCMAVFINCLGMQNIAKLYKTI